MMAAPLPAIPKMKAKTSTMDRPWSRNGGRGNAVVEANGVVMFVGIAVISVISFSVVHIATVVESFSISKKLLQISSELTIFRLESQITRKGLRNEMSQFYTI